MVYGLIVDNYYYLTILGFFERSADRYSYHPGDLPGEKYERSSIWKFPIELREFKQRAGCHRYFFPDNEQNSMFPQKMGKKMIKLN